MKWRSRHLTAAVSAWVMLWAAATQAHIKNEATQFPDIEFSAARFDIVALVGAGIIPETPVFEPDKTLSKEELAAWAALAKNLARGGETPDVDSLARLALENGLVDSLEGDATLAEINSIFFSGALQEPDSAGHPTKAEAATYIASALGGPAGDQLLAQRGLAHGATGDNITVATHKGHHGNAYVITIGQTTLEMDGHGRVANGPTDLLQWDGFNVRRSFVRGTGDDAKWVYLEAAVESQETAPVDEATTGTIGTEPEPVSEAAGPVDEAAEIERQAGRSLLLILLAVVVILGAALFFRGSRKR